MKKLLVRTVGAQKWVFYRVSPKSKHLIDDEGNYAFAICDYEKCKVYISSALAGDALNDAVWHEYFHIVFHVIGAQQVHKANEAMVTAITPVVHRNMAEDGHRFKFLT